MLLKSAFKLFNAHNNCFQLNEHSNKGICAPIYCLKCVQARDTQLLFELFNAFEYDGRELCRHHQIEFVWILDATPVIPMDRDILT